jgi:hypothetical protein
MLSYSNASGVEENKRRGKSKKHYCNKQSIPPARCNRPDDIKFLFDNRAISKK